MRFVRAGLCGLLVLGVAAHGGVEEWARAAFECGAGLLLLIWAVRYFVKKEEQIFVTPLLLPLVAFLLVALVQLVLGQTASQYTTRQEVLLFVADVVVLFLAGQSYRTLHEWRGFIWFVMIFGFVVALFGILQHLTFNGKLYWFREMRYGGIPFGPYVNRNHFAGLMELVIPLSLVPLALGKVRRERWFLVGLFALVPVGALFLSLSRGGIVSLAVEVGVLLLMVFLRRSGGKHVLALGVVFLAALMLVSWLGVGEVLNRFSSLQSREVTEGKRASMRRDTWRIFLDHPLLGTGLGTLPLVYPPYESRYDGKIVNHTHNDYLEALSDTGILGGVCCAWFIGLLFWKSLREILSGLGNTFGSVLHLSGLVGCTGFLVHSLVDFNLHIPANAMLFFLMAQLSAGELQQLPQAGGQGRVRRRRHKRHE